MRKESLWWIVNERQRSEARAVRGLPSLLQSLEGKFCALQRGVKADCCGGHQPKAHSRGHLRIIVMLTYSADLLGLHPVHAKSSGKTPTEIHVCEVRVQVQHAVQRALWRRFNINRKQCRWLRAGTNVKCYKLLSQHQLVQVDRKLLLWLVLHCS